jgi:hypothetical protein
VSRFRAILAGQNREPVSDRSTSSIVSRKPKQAQVRLTGDELDVVIEGYEAGLDLKELSSAFGADRRALSNRLGQRGIPRRDRRLSDDQIQETVTLYQNGWSLAPSPRISTSTRRVCAIASSELE